MKSKIYIAKLLFFSCLIVALGFTLGGCSDDEVEVQQSGYGYVQFKLFKSASYADTKTRAATNELEYLGEAQKMKVILINEEDATEVTQTVSLNAMGENSELGLRSEKLQLMVGKYKVVGFYLYKVEGQELVPVVSGEPEENTVITVVDGGLAVQDIQVKVVERGNLKFTLKKKIVSETKTAENTDNFLFSDVHYARIVVRDRFTKLTTTFENVPFEYKEKVGTDHQVYAVAESDSLLSLRSGTYETISYILYDKNKKTLDGDDAENAVFEIKDNQTTEADMPVKLYRSSNRIKDYLALKEIWDALDGPNWKYSGNTYPAGTNWNFDKEIDMWGEQPGVDIDAKGRITVLNLGSFGAKGDIPAALGQLTELKILTVGTHSDMIGDNMIEQWGEEITTSKKEEWRNDYYNKFLKKDLRATFSEPLQLAFEMQGKSVEKGEMASGRGIRPKDVSPGHLSNGIKGIPEEIENLTKLQQLFIANGKFEDFAEGTDFSNLSDLTDVEIYNCPSMKKLPEALFTMPNIELLNLANNPQIASAVFEEGLKKLATGASKEKLQILYLGNNRLTLLPDEFKNFKKLGKLDCNNNQIKKIPAFGKGINLVQLTMDYNQIEEVPRDAEGYFCGYEDVETFSFSHNKLKEVPNIFNSESVFVMSSVDFSFNEITGFQDGENYRGINVNTLSLGGNRLKTFPGILFKKNSQIGALALNGNGMEEFPDGSLKGTYTYLLTSLDLTYNKLSKLPKEFNAVVLPYLYGIDMSNNRFSTFPTGPLNVDHLTVFGLRNQRNEKGDRIMKTWPTGIYMCPSLRALYLGGNDLRKIEDTISPNIYIFEIKDNPNIVIDLSSICSLIKQGYYQLIYDTTQDIRGCDALDLEK